MGGKAEERRGEDGRGAEATGGMRKESGDARGAAMKEGGDGNTGAAAAGVETGQAAAWRMEPGGAVAAPLPPRGIAAALRVFTINPFGPLRGRRGWVLLALTLLPVLLVVTADLFGAERGGGGRFFSTIVAFVYHYIEMVVFIFLGCASLGEDMENRVLTYDLVCPVSREAIFAGRWLGYLASAFLLLVPVLVAMYSVCMARYGMDAFMHNVKLLWAVLIAAAAGALVYGSLFILLSLVMKRAVLAAVILAICVEVFVANIPFRISTFSVLYHLRNIMAAVSGEIDFFPPPAVEIGKVADAVSPLGSVAVLAVLFALFTLGGVLLFKRKQFP